MKCLFSKLILLCSIILVLQSCSKVVRTNYTYTLKGRVIDSNSLQPAPQFELILRVSDGYMGSKIKEIERTISDGNGNFVFTVPTEYNRNLRFKDVDWEFSLPYAPKNGDTIDIGEGRIEQ